MKQPELVPCRQCNHVYNDAPRSALERVLRRHHVEGACKGRFDMEEFMENLAAPALLDDHLRVMEQRAQEELEK